MYRNLLQSLKPIKQCYKQVKDSMPNSADKEYMKVQCAQNKTLATLFRQMKSAVSKIKSRSLDAFRVFLKFYVRYERACGTANVGVTKMGRIAKQIKLSRREILESYVKGWLSKPSGHPYIVEYAANFAVAHDFGSPGAVIVTSLLDKKIHLAQIVVHGFNESC
ncbi:uncharacterized protein LOC132626427 [Lycium barbarum]|uniref:uncharacterized protein LOC132626427 n=1 Tax=Lycium barbarum TaxID=112863 RepID=UPI00293EBD8F|nr:uncharacterized protein LOC132626427 [Lycium barbarum]